MVICTVCTVCNMHFLRLRVFKLTFNKAFGTNADVETGSLATVSQLCWAVKATISICPLSNTQSAMPNSRLPPVHRERDKLATPSLWLQPKFAQHISRWFSMSFPCSHIHEGPEKKDLFKVKSQILLSIDEDRQVIFVLLAKQDIHVNTPRPPIFISGMKHKDCHGPISNLKIDWGWPKP